MKNIAIFCHDYKGSGANLSLADWLKDADKNRYNYIVVLPRYNKEYYELLKKNGIDKIIVGHFMVNVKKMYKQDAKSKIKDIIKRIYELLFNKFWLMVLLKRLKKENIDAIHSNSFSIKYGAEIAIKLKLPHVWHIREFMEEDHQITHYNSKHIEFLAGQSHAIFISDVIAKKYVEKYDFIDSNVLYNKISYNESYKKNKKFLENGICDIIMVGTLSKNKGHLDALNAMKKLNDSQYKCKLHICGRGPYESYLKSYVENNDIKNVEFLGHISNVNEIRKNMDIALMCSENEALGRVTVEAQYYENLIIGANCGCTPFIIDDGITGYLYDKNISDDLFWKIKDSIDFCEKSRTIIADAKIMARSRFDKNISKDIMDIYDKILIK